VLRHLIPLVAGRHEGPRLHALSNLVDDVVGQLAATREPELERSFGVSCNCLSIRAALARNLSITLRRRPAAKHFFHIDHG